MVKADMIEAIAKSAHLKPSEAKAALDALIKATCNALKKGEKVKLVSFGTFTIGKRKERKGKHPQTGKDIIIQAKKVVRFKPAATLIAKRVKTLVPVKEIPE